MSSCLFFSGARAGEQPLIDMIQCSRSWKVPVLGRVKGAAAYLLSVASKVLREQ